VPLTVLIGSSLNASMAEGELLRLE
jgi:hypothetical protein